MRKIKCSQCGGNEFYQSDRSILQEQWAWVMSDCGNYGTCNPTIEVYFCKKCGHIEMFVNDEFKRKHEEKVQHDLEYHQKLEAFEKNKNLDIEKLEKEINNLETIINDDNNSVKLVNQSKEKLIEAKTKLEQVKNSKFEEINENGNSLIVG